MDGSQSQRPRDPNGTREESVAYFVPYFGVSARLKRKTPECQDQGAFRRIDIMVFMVIVRALGDGDTRIN